VRGKEKAGGKVRGFRRVRGAKRAAQEAERQQARAIQAGLLPRGRPHFEGFEIEYAWEPSEEVSGDVFDVSALDGERLALCIADVSGKGLAAATLAKELRAAVREFAPQAESPAALCTAVNQALCRPGAQTRYATMFYGVLEREGRLRYESAGHCPPLLVRGDGSVEFPAGFSGVIGIFSHWLYQNQEIELRRGDCLLLITDGILQAENARGEEFGYQRLIAAVERGRADGVADLGREILRAVREFCEGKMEDDASLVAVVRSR
jgi:phosphoserine phosphatase RsbU/P